MPSSPTGSDMAASHGLALISLEDKLSLPTPTIQNNREKNRVHEAKGRPLFRNRENGKPAEITDC